MVEIIAALITGVASLASGWYGGNRSGKKKLQSQFELQAEANAKSFQDGLVDRFGWKAASCRSFMEVFNTEGDARCTRSWRGVQPNDGISISHMPGMFWTGTPGSSIRKYPEVEVVGEFPKHVSIVKSTEFAQECKYRVEIVGSLTHDDPLLDFDLTVEYEKTVLMTSAEVEKAYASDVFKNDYMAFDVEIPIDEIEIEVAFPPESGFKAFPCVFFGSSELVHNKELQRTSSGFHETGNGGVFVIKHPFVGL